MPWLEHSAAPGGRRSFTGPLGSLHPTSCPAGAALCSARGKIEVVCVFGLFWSVGWGTNTQRRVAPPRRFRADTEPKRSGVVQGLVTDGVLLLSEGPGSSPGFRYLSRGSLCGGV